MLYDHPTQAELDREQLRSLLQEVISQAEDEGDGYFSVPINLVERIQRTLAEIYTLRKDGAA